MSMKVFEVDAVGTGDVQYNICNFPIIGVIWFGGSYGSNPNVVQRNFLGAFDGTDARGSASFGDSTGRASDRSSAYDIVVENRVSSSIVRVFEGKTKSFDNLGGGQYGLTITQATNTVTPKLYGVAFG